MRHAQLLPEGPLPAPSATLGAGGGEVPSNRATLLGGFGGGAVILGMFK
jgi:hypothetical protein